jgi:hypothetical protein
MCYLVGIEFEFGRPSYSELDVLLREAEVSHLFYTDFVQYHIQDLDGSSFAQTKNHVQVPEILITGKNHRTIPLNTYITLFTVASRKDALQY